MGLYKSHAHDLVEMADLKLGKRMLLVAYKPITRVSY
jgi:hypothetical protein